jgi:hypothetical protein
MRTRSWAALIAIALAGCNGAECQPESQPFHGQPRTAEELFAVVQYLAKSDCCDQLWSHLSPKSQAEHGETKFCLFWETIEIPEYGYLLADVVKQGKFVAAVEGPKKGEWLVYVEYEEPGKKNLLAAILVSSVRYLGSPTPRVGLVEQVERIEAGDGRYWWDAGS